MVSLHDIDRKIENWIYRTSEYVDNNMHTLTVDTKTHEFDLVTDIDQYIQNDFEQFIKQHFPDHQVIGEEKDNHLISADKGYVWAIDPIDGTTNLVKLRKEYCLVLSLFKNGSPLLAYTYDFYQDHLYKGIVNEGVFLNGNPLTLQPYHHFKEGMISFNPTLVSNELFKALIAEAHGFRFNGSGGLEAIKVINGSYIASIDFNASLWDMSAQILFAKELGLIVSDLNGNTIDVNNVQGAVISYPVAHQSIIKALKAYTQR